MSKRFSFADLDPDFARVLQKLAAICALLGVEMRPYCGLRDPFEQARLWRQSRTLAEINAEIAGLRANGASFLADVLESVGPQFGPPVTNALPGYSWHQWGEAADAVWIVNGRAEWSTDRAVVAPGTNLNGYRTWAYEAEKLGLTAGGHWQRFKDWPHVQKSRFEVGAGQGIDFSSLQVSAIMEQRFAQTK